MCVFVNLVSSQYVNDYVYLCVCVQFLFGLVPRVGCLRNNKFQIQSNHWFLKDENCVDSQATKKSMNIIPQWKSIIPLLRLDRSLCSGVMQSRAINYGSVIGLFLSCHKQLWRYHNKLWSKLVRHCISKHRVPWNL